MQDIYVFVSRMNTCRLCFQRQGASKKKRSQIKLRRKSKLPAISNSKLGKGKDLEDAKAKVDVVMRKQEGRRKLFAVQR